MRLKTLGGLSLEGAAFKRLKPLLLLSYLALEGPQDRRHLAELFWPGAADGLNSLSVALGRLRKGAPGSVEADELRAWTHLKSDAHDLVALQSAGAVQELLLLYKPFLAGVYLPDWGTELEEWVYAKREDLAQGVQRALLRFAESRAAQGRFDEAAAYAEAARELAGAAEPEPEELARLYTLLRAGESPSAAEVRRAVEAYGIALELSATDARARLQRVLVGRAREVERLLNLAEGEWAWICGGAGMGKTALLKSLGGSYLPGRSGLPFATLEALAGPALQEGEAVILQRLLRLRGLWLFDNWERIDTESQALLKRLRELRGAARVVISSREKPPFGVDAVLELSPLSPEDLRSYPQVWEQTGGLPALVGSLFRNEPLTRGLEASLLMLSAEAREACLALALLDSPDLTLARRVLQLDASVMARVVEELLAAGLIEPSGQVRVRQAALEYLDAHPTQLASLSLKLARCLEGTEAYPLYERSRPLWTLQDEPKIIEAYLAWARELLRRGFPQRAVEALDRAPQIEDTSFLKGRALELSGRYREALDIVRSVPETSELQALKGILYWRLGQSEEARKAAKSALEGSMEARAEALNTLGHLARSHADYEEAVRLYRRAAVLWRAQGERTRWVETLSNLALTRSEQGEASERAFREALEAAEENLVLQARVLLNLGLYVYAPQERFEEAERTYRTCIALAEQVGLLEISIRAWNNLGVLYHLQERTVEARAAYEQALEAASRAGEKLMLGSILANLAELAGDVAAWEEALRMLEDAGHQAMAERFRLDLPRDHPFRQEEKRV